MGNQHVVKIDFTKREVTGTGACRKIRSKNLIPVVLYGPNYKDGLPGTVSARAITPVANGAHRDTTLLELAISDGTEAAALIRDVQRHPLSRVIRHVDLYQVLPGHKVKVEIPVTVINAAESKGVKEGGILTHAARLVLVEVQPSDIPDAIVVDAKDLEGGAEVFVKDLAAPEGVTIISNPDTLVLHITALREADEGEEEGEAKEVEVVAKGKAAKAKE